MVTDDGLIKQYFVYGFDVIVVFVILIVSAHDGSSIDVALIGSKRIASHRSDSFTSFYNRIWIIKTIFLLVSLQVFNRGHGNLASAVYG